MLTLLTMLFVSYCIEVVLGDHGQSWLPNTPSIDSKKSSITKKNGQRNPSLPKVDSLSATQVYVVWWVVNFSHWKSSIPLLLHTHILHLSSNLLPGEGKLFSSGNWSLWKCWKFPKVKVPYSGSIEALVKAHGVSWFSYLLVIVEFDDNPSHTRSNLIRSLRADR